MMFSPWTAAMPMESPRSLRFHGAGNARIAATSTIVASTPLHPASIDTAKPLVPLCSSFPSANTPGSKTLTIPALMAASVSVHGTTNHRCAHGVSSTPNRSASRTRKPRKKRTIGRVRPALACIGPRQRRIAREILLDPGAHRCGEFSLIALVAELLLLVGIGDECCLDQNRRNVWGLEHCEPGLFDAALVQRVDRADAVEDRASHAQAAPDLRRLRHVEPGPGEDRLHGV